MQMGVEQSTINNKTFSDMGVEVKPMRGGNPPTGCRDMSRLRCEKAH
jgi:hypothetical protein